MPAIVRAIRVLGLFLTLIAHAVAWGVLLGFLAFVVPMVEALCLDFGFEPPGVTVLLFRASHLVIAPAPLLAILLVADWSLLAFLARWGEPGVYRAWSVLMLASPLLLIALTLAALALAWFAYHQGMTVTG